MGIDYNFNTSQINFVFHQQQKVTLAWYRNIYPHFHFKILLLLFYGSRQKFSFSLSWFFYQSIQLLLFQSFCMWQRLCIITKLSINFHWISQKYFILLLLLNFAFCFTLSRSNLKWVIFQTSFVLYFDLRERFFENFLFYVCKVSVFFLNSKQFLYFFCVFP